MNKISLLTTASAFAIALGFAGVALAQPESNANATESAQAANQGSDNLSAGNDAANEGSQVGGVSDSDGTDQDNVGNDNSTFNDNSTYTETETETDTETNTVTTDDDGIDADAPVNIGNESKTETVNVTETDTETTDDNSDDDGIDVDAPGDENCIHIVGSALKLMKDARFWTHQRSGFYKTNVCYGPTRAIFTRQAQIGHPIIIDLRRLICTPDDDVEGGYRYTYNGGAILYFEPDGNGRFQYRAGDTLTNEQKAKVGMVCEACSMVLTTGTVPDDADAVFCDQDYDTYKAAILNTTIVDLIMYGLSSHPEVTTQIHTESNQQGLLTEDQTIALTDGHNMQVTRRNDIPVVNPGDWVLATRRIPFPDATTPDWDILLEKASLLSVLPKFNATTSQYKAPVRGDRS